MESAPEDRLPSVIYFTKGLAAVVVDELRALAPDAKLSEPTERFVVVSVDAADLALLRSSGRTFDDLRLLVAGPAAIPAEASFDQLCAQAAETTRAYLHRHDPARTGSEPWSVTLSARTPSWRRRPAWDPEASIAARLGDADLHARTRREVDLRIQVDGEEAHISLNLAARPHSKQESGPVRMGALRPSVAASLVRLALSAAEPSSQEHGLYDPCCGTGTIPAEALRLAVPVYASDVDPEAVATSSERLAAVAETVHPAPLVRVFPHDLLRGPPRDVAARIVASNLPWGKQVQLQSRRELFDAIATLTARGVAEGGASALLTTSEQQLVARIRRHAPQARVNTWRIGLLGQTPAVVVAGPG